MENQNEPRLEDYGLDASSYENYRLKKEEIDAKWLFSLYPVFFFVGIMLFIFSIFNWSISRIIISVILIIISYFLKNKNNEFKKEIEIIKEKVGKFEESIIIYYENKLDVLFKNNLYKKKSNSPVFEIYLSKFLSLIDKVKNINKRLIFGKISLTSKINNKNYINYAIDRSFSSTSYFNKVKEKSQFISVDYNNKTDQFIKIETSIKKPEKIIEVEENKKKGFWTSMMDDINEEIEKSNNPIDTINKGEEKENIIDINPPETKYRAPRKIDWDSINETKKITGLKGEEIVLKIEKSYLNSIKRQDLSEKVKHVSKEIGDGLGYDILSYFADGQEKYIEVKSSNRTNNNSFYLSQNELNFMKNNINNSVIYRIFNINENEEIPILRVHRADDILGFKQIIPDRYIVKME